MGMSRWALIFFFVALLCSWARAQPTTNPGCPAINITGPASVVTPGDLATYSVEIRRSDLENQGLQYVWSTSSGEIISGQGTTSIQIRRTDTGTLIATVDVKGLPEGCPTTASDTLAQCEGVPIPVKLAEFDGTLFRGDRIELNQIVREMNDNPTSQLYVFFGYKTRATVANRLAREAEALKFLAGAIGGAERITSEKIYRGADLIQFWRVPPGSVNPTCDECDLASCPKLSVIGPAAEVMPGDGIVFTANLSNGQSENLNYKWLISAGTITEGQGTPNITVATDRSITDVVTASVTIEGLPGSCASQASQTAYMAGHRDILLDEINSTAATKIRKQLDEAVNELNKRPGSHLVFILYTSKNESPASRSRRETFIRNYLATTRKIGSSQMQFVSGGVNVRRGSLTKIYLLMPARTK